MLDDLTKDIKAQLNERARSPLLGAFMLAWVAWNFRAVLALLSTIPVQEKLAFWSELYPSSSVWVVRAIVLPLATTIAFIVLYPYPARWAYHYWRLQYKKLKVIQQRIDDEMPLTQAEATQIRRTALEQQAQMQNQLRDLADVNRELANQREALLTRVAELQRQIPGANVEKDLDELVKEARGRAAEIIQLAEKRAGQLIDEARDAAKAEGNRILMETEQTGSVLPPSTVEQQLSDEAKQLLIAAANADGMILRAAYIGGTNIQVGGRNFVEGKERRTIARWEAAVDELEAGRLVEDKAGKRQLYFVTHDGYRVADGLPKS